MKTQNDRTYSKYIGLIALTLTAALLTACGNTKSNPTTSTSNVNIYSAKSMANCNKTKDSNFSISTASVTDQSSGQLSTQWIKLKFNFISSAATASGNTIKFFKWRVVGSASQLDSTPLIFATYDLASGTTVGSQVNTMNTADLSANNGLYINLNDPNVQAQVIKAVVYDSTGAIVAQMNSLIPGFYASPVDYQYNSDSTPRAAILQQMHALYGTDVTGWSATQLQNSFDQYCF